MSFSVAKVRPFRSLGLYRSSGKHAAPRASVQWPLRPAAGDGARRPAHAPKPGESRQAHHETAALRPAVLPQVTIWG